MSNSVYFETILSLINQKKCHCNTIFKRKTRLILLLNSFIPKETFESFDFSFRRTGIHPPHF